MNLAESLTAAARALPHAYPGPGGAAAVLHRGEVLLRHAWGWANAERGIAFTPRTLFRMCSVTKQFTCAALLDACPDLSALDGAVQARLPKLEGAAPAARHLCHNQSGLRDYWAVAMLHGSPAEGPFGDREAERLIAGTRTLQFEPGTRYAYCNQNFRILSDILAERTGQSFADALRTRVFDRAGMETACLAADTRSLPDGTEGYEGTVAAGFRPAVNRVLWTGDAGLGASLDDTIAWERHIDATRDDPGSLYGRLRAPVAFADGAPAAYGFGLGRWTAHGRAVTGHGGALRGWRCQRLHVGADRISVVVLFNHMADARGAAADLLAAALGEPAAAAPGPAPLPSWLGPYVEPETGLSARIEAGPPGQVRLRFGHHPELLTLRPDGSASDRAVTLRTEPGGLRMERLDERLSTLLQPRAGAASANFAGRYRNDELGADLVIEDAGGVLYGAFAGFLGAGRLELLHPIGPDLWALPCPRALDHTPPGDWTLAVQRDGNGAPAGIELGCWLARGLLYQRTA